MLLLSCGCTVKSDNDVYLISIASQYREEDWYKPCIVQNSYCRNCYIETLSNPSIKVLLTLEDEMNYLKYPEDY